MVEIYEVSDSDITFKVMTTPATCKYIIYTILKYCEYIVYNPNTHRICFNYDEKIKESGSNVEVKIYNPMTNSIQSERMN